MNEHKQSKTVIQREAVLRVEDGATADAPKIVRLTASTETPVREVCWFNDAYQECFRILDHSPESVDLTRCAEGMPVTDGHYGDQIGLIRNVQLVERKLGGAVEWCAGDRAANIGSDAARGLRRNVSIDGEVDPESYVLEGEQDGCPVIRVRRWTPHRVAFVTLQADIKAGVGREMQEPENPAQTVASPAKPAITREITVMENETKPAPVARDLGREATEILDIAAEYKLDGKVAREAISKGLTPEQFKAGPLVVELATRSANTAAIGMSDKEVKRFSIRNAILAQIPNSGVKADFERACSEASAQKLGKQAVRGIMIPHDVLVRDLAITGTGSAVVQTSVLGGSFIEALRAKAVLSKLGAQYLSGLVGDIALPKLATATTCYWISTEGNAPPEGLPVLAQVPGTPHTIAGWVDVTRKLLKQGSIDVEMMIQNDIAQGLAVGVDAAGFSGAGGSGEPQGIIGASGVGNPTVTTGTPTWAQILGFIASIGGNFANVNAAKWALTHEVFAKLGSTQKTPTYGDAMLLDVESRTMAGFPYELTEQVGANTLVFGDFSQLIIAMWGGVDLTVDTASLSTSGGVRTVCFQDCDMLIRHGGAFAYNSAVTA